jgi:hypothetical protein
MVEQLSAVSIFPTEEPDLELLASLFKPYFPALQTEFAVQRWCRTSHLGRAVFHFAYWGDRLAAVQSVFPFPLLIDGEKVVVGKPELAALHQDLTFVKSRPDVFGSLIDEGIRSARQRGVRLLHTRPSQIAMKSLRKRGFRAVTMPLTKVKWPLTASCLSDCFSSVASGRLGHKRAVGKTAKYLAQASKFLPLRASAKFATMSRAHYAFQTLPLESLPDAEETFHASKWAGQRIHVPWDGNFLSSRLRNEDGHEFLSVIDREKNTAVGSLILQRKDNGGLMVIDGTPGRVYATGRFWVSFLRYAINRGAEYVSVRFHHNNSVHCAALNVISSRIPGLTVTSQSVVAALALDRKLDFAYDPCMWAGSDMLGVGFGT